MGEKWKPPTHRAMAKTLITVEVEIELESCWGSDCSMEQVHKQATEDANRQTQQMIDRIRQGVNSNNIKATNVRAAKVVDMDLVISLKRHDRE